MIDDASLYCAVEGTDVADALLACGYIATITITIPAPKGCAWRRYPPVEQKGQPLCSGT